MKHIHWYILALAAVLLAGCSKESGGDILVPDAPQQNGYTPSTTPVGFAVDGDWVPTTKADPTVLGIDPSKTKFYAGDMFGVLAYYIPAGGAIGTPNFMYNQIVTAQDATPGDPEDFSISGWDYSPKKYWPNNTGDKVSFYAYYPASRESITLPANTAQGPPSITYTPANHHTDILYATATDKTKPAAGEAVSLNFQHMLGQLRFKISVNNNADGNQTIWVKSIGYNVIPQGTFNFADASWTNKAAERLYTAQVAGTGYEITEGTEYICHAFTSFLIPISINSLIIELDTDGNNTEKITAPVQTPIEVQQGKVTTVSLAIATKNISITATTQPWIEKPITPTFTPDK